MSRASYTLNQKAPNWISRKTLLSIFILVIAGAVVGAGIVYSSLAHSEKLIPSDISQQVAFGIYYPTTHDVVTVDTTSFTFNSQAGVLDFASRTANNTLISFSEQATPESFVDIPQAYDKLVSSLQPYSNFDSVNGKVSLTRPPQLQGRQSAVINSKGTLMFVRADKDLSNQEWRQIFNDLQIVR